MSALQPLSPPGSGALSRERKAAMVVQMLLAGGRRLPLDRLPEHIQLKLTKELAQLKLVDKGTVDSVATEFTAALEEVGLAAPGTAEHALQALEGQISEEAMARLRIEIGGVLADPWPALVNLPAPILQEIIDCEAIEVSAILLSKLPTEKAAKLLAAIPGATARSIALAVSRTDKVSPSNVHAIGSALARDYVSNKIGAFTAEPAPRVGAILNITNSQTRDELLEGLDEDDPEFATEVRRSIFTFSDIPDRVQPTDLPKVLRLIDNNDLIVALIASNTTGEAGQASVEWILSNMSKRMAEGLREEMADKAKVKKTEGEIAMTAVVEAIRDAADKGEIILVDPGDDEDE